MKTATQSQPPAAGQAAHTPTLIEFVAEIDRLIDAHTPSTHLWNYCVLNRKVVLRDAVRHDMSARKVLAHHKLMPGRVAENTEALLSDLQACNPHAALVALLEAAENAVYWGLKQHALEVEQGVCEANAKPGYIVSLQDAAKQARAALADAKGEA